MKLMPFILLPALICNSVAAQDLFTVSNAHHCQMPGWLAEVDAIDDGKTLTTAEHEIVKKSGCYGSFGIKSKIIPLKAERDWVFTCLDAKTCDNQRSPDILICNYVALNKIVNSKGENVSADQINAEARGKTIDDVIAAAANTCSR